MATVQVIPARPKWIVKMFTNDFCPGANKYVYWLKEPIGWFVLAAIVSVMVGLYVNPVGWTLATALVAIMIVGMAWPFIAVRVATGRLRPDVEAVHEGSTCRMVFSIRNRLPLPLWGLAVEGYLDRKGDELTPVVGLACVPPLCTAQYSIAVTPPLRGHYPLSEPKLACSFPFGIWTARRQLADTQPLTVWPRVYSIANRCPIIGKANVDEGDGARGGIAGDIVGARPYRRGDSPRHIHWVQSARQDQWIVTERGGPQCPAVEVIVDISSPKTFHGEADLVRNQVAWRIRVAASLLRNLHDHGIPFRVRLGTRLVSLAKGRRARVQILDALADVPADGEPLESTPTLTSGGNVTRLYVRDTPGGYTHSLVDIVVRESHAASRFIKTERALTVRGGDGLASDLGQLWEELEHAAHLV